ncbi:MAG: hypothetical protein K5765_03325 [Clostridia bacterium]|nr:hypothetical protein [Clostridia bacterium]
MLNFIEFTLEKTKKYNKRYNEISELLQYPEIQADPKLYKKLINEQSKLVKIYDYTNDISSIYDLIEILKKNNNKEDEKELDSLYTDVKQKITLLNFYLAKMEETSFNFVVEIISSNNAIKEDLSNLIIDLIKTLNGTINIKNDVMYVTNSEAYRLLVNFSGRHTYIDSNGQKEYVSIFVYENKQIDSHVINDKDIEINIYHSSGAGGQNINKVSTAVRIKHIPTNIVVTCQDERSQLKNKERAIKMLEKRVAEYYNINMKKYIDEIKMFELGINNKSTITIDNLNKKFKDFRIEKIYNYPISVNEFLEYLISFKVEK